MLNFISILHTFKARQGRKIRFQKYSQHCLKTAFYLQMNTMAKKTFEIMKQTPYFEEDQNLWLQIFPGEDHSMFSWLERLWSVFSILSKDRY